MSFSYRWRLADVPEPPPGAPEYLSIFSGAGGSSMGYLLAGFRQRLAVECDPQMAAVYRANLGGEVLVEMVQDFKKRDLGEYKGIDMLDGSPPCSAFSMSGKRDEHWGKDREWSEGAVTQKLEDLFQEFLDVAEVIRPQIVLAENVLGMVVGKARGYAKAVLRRLDELGYDAQLFRLNACTMGVPQARERVFYLGRRRDLELPPIRLEFTDVPIRLIDALRPEDAVGQATLQVKYPGGKWKNWNVPKHWLTMWEAGQPGAKLGASVTGEPYLWDPRILDPRAPCPTICADCRSIRFHWDEPRSLTDREMAICQSFPTDFDYGDEMPPQQAIGMSVPPVMMARIAEQIREQWFDERQKADAA